MLKASLATFFSGGHQSGEVSTAPSYRATKNLFAVMNVMGHTTVSTTMKYQHQNIDEVAEVASHRVQ
jgi:hypothetical protein